MVPVLPVRLFLLGIFFVIFSLGTPLSLDEIHNLLVSGDPAHKKKASTALFNMGFVQLLQSSLSPDGIMRAAALSCISSLADPRALPTLVRVAVTDPYADSRHEAVIALGRLAEEIPAVGKDIFQTLQNLRVNSTDTNLRWFSTNALGMLGQRDVVPEIHNVLKLTDQPDVAWQGLVSLARVPTQGTALLAYELVMHPEVSSR